MDKYPSLISNSKQSGLYIPQHPSSIDDRQFPLTIDLEGFAEFADPTINDR